MILAILQARMSSKRLPGKVLKNILEKPILAYEIERIKQSTLIDKIVLATSMNEDDLPLVALADKIGIECYRGDLDNVLKRFYECATYHKADIIVRLTGDCPLIDPSVIDEVIRLHQESNSDYTSNTLYRTFPDGLDVEVMSYETLKKTYENAIEKDELEHVTKYIYSNKDKFLLSNYRHDIDYSYIRWTLDTIEDFYFFKNFYEKKQNVNFRWQEALSFTNDNKKFLIESNQTIRFAMKKLEEIVENEIESLYVIDYNKVVGTISTSDIRRSLIYEDITNNDQITKIMNTAFKFLENGKIYTKNDLHKLLKYKILPVLDGDFNLVKFQNISELTMKKNLVVLMAGGLGSRLKDITLDTPKPMLNIGGKPILETIIDQFSKQDYKNFYISVNHMSNKIIDYFENGESLGVKIKYLKENRRMGTAGCLGLIEEKLKHPIFVMNGDILANIDFDEMMGKHIRSGNEITIAIIKRQTSIPYGVIDLKKEKVVKISEKPIYEYNVSAGVYILNPSVLKDIPKKEFYDITSLFDNLLKANKQIGVYVIDDYWLDIGRPEDFYKAHDDYMQIFKEGKFK